ncbi:hypothetical protein SUGI_0222830 [Cryptomeria japonica]|nr:hypothetical protein SUGI_0222830 [Cryptomeria japonica]
MTNSEHVIAQEVLQMFIEIARIEPQVLLNFVDVVGSMLHIVEAECLKKRTRISNLAIEFIISFADGLSSHSFIDTMFITFAMDKEMASTILEESEDRQGFRRLFTIIMKMLLDKEDDPSWHTTNCQDEDVGQYNNYNVVQVFVSISHLSTRESYCVCCI